MNLSEVAKFVEQPVGFENSQVQELKALVDKYPYAQSFAILYLKALSDLQSFHFEDELKKHACAITNRAVLFDLINATPETERPEEEKENIQTVEKTPESIEKPIVEEKTVVEALDTTIAIDLSSTTTEAKETDEIEKTKEAIEIVPESSDDVSPLEVEILSSAFSSVASIESEIEFSIHPENEVEEEIVGEEATQENTSEKKNFIAWLHASTSKEKEENQKKIKVNALIESFIDNSPKISSPKSDFYSANKKAVESVEENAIPVSPTLAKIYALQGHYPKSIAIYQQLILKYPEKKTYFANQIKELEKKLNS